VIPTREALQKLENLPTTAAIADELVSMGIKARPKKSDECAIACYLTVTTGCHVGVGLNIDGHTDGNEELIGVVLVGRQALSSAVAALLNYDRQILQMPQVAHFIREFDEGKYPKLVEE
jgi:hypothetical protein